MGIPRPDIPPPEPWQFPVPTVAVSAAGMKVVGYHLPHQALVTAIVVLDVPPSDEPAGRRGITWLTARALGTGAAGLSSREFKARLESLGASLDSTANRAGISIRLTVPARRLRAALTMLADTITRPALVDDEIHQLIRLRLDEIAQQRSEPRTRAQLEFSRTAFTAESRQSCPVPGTAETVRTLDGPAVRRFYRDNIAPAAATLILAGDLATLDLTEIAQAFTGLSSSQAGVRQIPAPATHGKPRAVLVDLPGAAQSQFMLGTAGTDRLDPSWPALTVAAHVLGGTVGSRLNRVLREQLGYTYGVRAAFDACRRGGTFTVSGAFHTEATAAALVETMRLVRGFIEDGLRPVERDASVDYFTRAGPLAYQTAQSVASRASDLLAHDLPLDFVDRNRAAVQALTPESVSESFSRLIDPQVLTLAVVGDAGEVAGALGAAGFQEFDCLPI